MESKSIKDVGIVVFSADNYGSAATNVALYRAIQKLGYDPIVLDTLAAPSGVSDRFFKRHLNVSSAHAKLGDYRWANDHCDAFVVGSDQSWRWSFPRFLKNCEYFLLAFAQDDKRKIAYAPSFGQEKYGLNEDIADMFKKLLPRFDAVSVREGYAVDMCKRLFGIDAEQVLDPVFLIDGEDYHAIAGESEVELPENYLLAYILEFSDAKYDLAKELAAKNGLQLVIICDAFYYEKKREAANKPEIIDKPELVDWLAYLANADMIMTDSFHGACFSLILEKPAAIVKARARNRFDSLAKMFDQCDEDARPVFFDSVEDALIAQEARGEINYSKINEEIRRARQGSLDWLSRALDGQDKGAIMAPEVARVEYARMARLVVGYEGRVADYASFAEQSELGAYFAELKSCRDYTVLLSCKDDCSPSWPRFVEMSKLPLKHDLPDHSSYVAVVHAGANLYERYSRDLIDMRFKLDLRNGLMLHADPGARPDWVVKRNRFPLGAFGKRSGGPEEIMLSVRMVSYRWNRATHTQISKILIDNVDYAMNRRGINVVVVKNNTGAVVDSFVIDLHELDNFVMQRR